LEKIMLKQVGASGQIALGKQFAGTYYELSEREDGVIELTPMEVIPKSQAWLHTPEMKKRLAESDKWMRENPVRTDNTEEILQMFEAHIAKKEAALKRTTTRKPKAA
jgi:hypothetical protein